MISVLTTFILRNLSAGHVEFSFTVRDFLDILGASWQKWIHSSGSESENNYYSTTAEIGGDHACYGGFDATFEVDIPPVDFVSNFIDKLSKTQKRALLT